MDTEDLQAVGGHRPREMAAVTGACLLARRADLLAVGGLNEGLPFNFNDVDLCFKFLRRGQRVVFNPEAMLVHHEGASREPVTHDWEWDRFVHRWAVVDPWYHPAFLRPDDPGDRRRNADHLLPGTVPEAGELRTAVVRSTHQAHLEATRAQRSPSRVLGVSEPIRSTPTTLTSCGQRSCAYVLGVDRCPHRGTRTLIATRDTQITEYDAEVNRLRDVVAQSAITRARQAIDRRRS